MILCSVLLSKCNSLIMSYVIDLWYILSTHKSYWTIFYSVKLSKVCLIWYSETKIIFREHNLNFRVQMDFEKSNCVNLNLQNWNVDFGRPHIGGFQLEFVSISQVINHMTCYKLSALIGGKFILLKKSFTRFALQSECCNFNQWKHLNLQGIMWLLSSLMILATKWKPPGYS